MPKTCEEQLIQTTSTSQCLCCLVITYCFFFKAWVSNEREEYVKEKDERADQWAKEGFKVADKDGTEKRVVIVKEINTLKNNLVLRTGIIGNPYLGILAIKATIS